MNIEKMRTSVLAYCEEVCPNEHNKAHLEVGMLKRQSMGSVYYWLHVDGLSTIAIHNNATDDHIFAAYRLLGLEARDAVEAYKASLQSDLKSMTSIVASVKNGEQPDYVHISKITELQSRNTALLAAGKALVTAVKVGAPLTESIIHQLVEFEKALTTNEKGGVQG